MNEKTVEITQRIFSFIATSKDKLDELHVNKGTYQSGLLVDRDSRNFSSRLQLGLRFLETAVLRSKSPSLEDLVRFQGILYNEYNKREKLSQKNFDVLENILQNVNALLSDLLPKNTDGLEPDAENSSDYETMPHSPVLA